MKRLLKNEDWLVTFSATVLIAFIVVSGLNLVPKFSWDGFSELFSKVIISSSTIHYIFISVILIVVSIVLGWFLEKNLIRFVGSFVFLLILSYLSFLLAGNSFIKSWGLEFVLFSLMIGLIIRNVFGVPGWLKEGLLSEFYVKIGLVILGSGILFSDILKAGSLGLIQAVVVVFSVWYFAFYLCKWLKIEKDFGLMISSAVSICGVSAAIATSGAIKGDSKKLSYVISLVMVTAIPMMLIMPYLAQYMHLSPAVTGAWLGGTIDTTGAVVVSGSIAGEEALNISTIVKFSQNVLLGVAAFLISVYWTYSNNQERKVEEKPSLKSIWERFPKFVLGFTVASLVFSFLIPSDIVADSKNTIKAFQQFWFSLSFLSIGLETNFKDFFVSENKKATFAFLLAQLFNVILTLGVAILVFG